MTYAELERFFEGLMARLRQRGVTCAITSGMACVHFGVAATTKDCDALCEPEAAERFLSLLSETRLQGSLPSYRGNLSPPLDARWLRGGWTSHFLWKAATDEAHLDVFGVAPRGTTRWKEELQGIYASPHTVAEMKRTDRDKDWPVVTALGASMLGAGDPRGWLHIFDLELLNALLERVPLPKEMVVRRPSLQLALRRDPRLKQVLRVERAFWEELDRARLKVYERAVRPYMAAVRKAKIASSADLLQQHAARVACAERSLAQNPLRDHGLKRLMAGARAEVSKVFAPDLLEWLPDVRDGFRFVAG
ncbi:MAG: hypothetical protein HY721_29485 [Planctomycetes bacterium]|nr:hypothetical protein [Planctomycetota bacterium]